MIYGRRLDRRRWSDGKTAQRKGAKVQRRREKRFSSLSASPVIPPDVKIAADDGMRGLLYLLPVIRHAA